MRFYLSTFLCVILFNISFVFGQNSVNLDHSGDHHNHDKCGFIQANQQRAASDPAYAQQMQDWIDTGLPKLSSEAYTKSFAPTITIPVVVHVIHNGEAIGLGANIADGQIQAQIDVMNEDFAALNGNYNNTPAQWQGIQGNPEIQFCLATIDPNGNSTNGITRDNIAITGTSSQNTNIESTIKPQTWWNSNNYMNIYVLGIPGTSTSGGVLGYAYLPFNGTVGQVNDGIVCDYRWFGGNSGWPNIGDKTMTHETGHYLGLSHTWEDVWGSGGCTNDDGISDTPLIEMATAQVNPNFNCFNGYPTGPVSCGNEHMYVNYMDYVNHDGCYTTFTQGQVNVMRAVMDGTAGGMSFGSRLPLANNSSAACLSIVNDDAGITAVINPFGQVCSAGPITPQVTLANFGTNNLTAVTINYTIAGGTPTTFNWTGSLAQNAMVNVTLPSFTPSAGVYAFNAYTTLPNGVTDQDSSNDATSLNSSYVTPQALPLFEDFETLNWDPTAQGIFPYNIDNDPFAWELTTAVSSNGIGSNAAVFNNYDGDNTTNPFNKVDAMITPTYDFSNVVGATLTFDYAYSGYNDGTQYLGDSLIILSSTDCGTTFNQRIYENGGVTLETVPGSAFKFVPNATQWGTATISLAAYDNASSLTLSFLNWSGYGNQLFIDNINISTACALTTSISGSNLLCNNVCNGTATASASGAVGTVTYQWDANAGSQTTATATSLCAGTYNVTITDGANCSETQQIVLTEPAAMSLSANGTNETIVNGNNGTATCTPGGGTPPYTYSWSNGMATQNISALAPNTYTVVVTDNNNCTMNAAFTVLPFNCPPINGNISSTNISCKGVADGAATVAPAGGATPYTYAWSNAQSTATVTGLSAGNYIVTISDANGCTSTANATITEPIALSATVIGTDESSVNGNNGAATVTPVDGTPGYTYLWSNGMTTATATGLAPGPHSVVVTDINNCTVTESVTVNPYVCPALNLSASSTNINCNGVADGTATASFNGGSGPWTYMWNNGMTAATLNGLTAGTYTVTLTDGNGCVENASVTITEPAAIVVTASATDETSANANDGTATASTTGGVATYSYSWDTGATTASITNLAPGNYTVVVTDANNCTATQTVTVNGISCVGMSVTASSGNITCFGANNGSANAVGVGGTGTYTYAWSNGMATQSILNLPMGTYTVTATDANNCPATSTITISEPLPFTSNATFTNETTAGAADGTATVVPQGGTAPYTYAWSNSMTTAMINSLAPGTYTVVVSDANNCTFNNSVTILSGSDPCSGVSGSIDKTDVSCNGGNDGIASIVLVGGMAPFTFMWSDGQTTQLATNLVAGNYDVTATDANSCPMTMSINIAQPSQIIVTITGTDETIAGANDGTLTATAIGGTTGTPGYSYAWSNGGNTAMITNLAPGNYTVTVADGNGCDMNVSEMVQSGSSPCTSFFGSATGTDVTCNGLNDGSAQVNTTGGQTPFTFMWSDGQTTQTATALIAGTYDVTVTDVNNCPLILNTVITEPTALAINVMSTDETVSGANDGTCSATVSGGISGYTYLWNNGATTATITNLPAGNYTVTITDSNVCTISGSASVLMGGNACAGFGGTINANDATCNGLNDGSAQVSITGGQTPFTYLWTDGQTTQTATALIAGAYDVTVTDANNCPVILSAVISAPPALVVNMVKTDETVSGANDGTCSVTVSGGTSGYTYMWNNGATTATITNLPAGNYTVTITDLNNCTTTGAATVLIGGSACAGFSGTINANDATCDGLNDGFTQVTMTGGQAPFTYLWSDGQATQSASALIAGTYDVTVTDANNCPVILSAVISAPAALVVNIGSTDETASGANDGTCSATVSGGTAGYTYLWSTGATTATISNLTSGNYIVTITDVNMCTVLGSASVMTAGNACAGFSGTVNANDATCNSYNDGAAFTNMNGGTPPYTYSWNNGQATQSVSNLVAGSYDVTVLDANNCSVVITTTVNEPTPIVISLTEVDETMAGANDGILTANVTGGMSGYAYIWNTGATTQTIMNLSPGAYTVTVTDNAGCSLLGVGSIQPAQNLCVGFNANINLTHVTCNGLSNGMATPQVVGGTPPFIYQWSNGQTTASATGLGVGNHSVGIVDANNCPINLNFTITEPLPLFITVSHTNETTAGASDGTATASTMGGTMPYAYLWDTGATTSTINSLSVGTYVVTITDGNNCTTTQTVSINSNGSNCAGFDLSTTAAQVSCFNGNDGTATALATGGAGPYSYSWSNGSNAPSISDLIAGVYVVTTMDVNGCIASETVMVDQPSVIQPNIIGLDGQCGLNGGATVNPNGGFAPYSYLWSNGETTNTVSNLQAGNYSVDITDAAGCAISASISIMVDPNFVSYNIAKMNVSCFNSNDGMIDLTVLTGTAPYTYFWSNGMTTEDITGLSEGTYMVTITDVNGCIANTNVLIDEPAPMDIVMSTINVTEVDNGMVIADATGGMAPYTYMWSNGVNGSVNNNLIPGTYTVTVTDSNGCQNMNTTIVEDITSVATIISMTNFNVYPNPTNAMLNIEATFTTFETVEIHLLNVVGQNIHSKLVEGNSISEIIDVTTIPAGTYLLKMSTPEGQVIEKITIVK